ncbi:polymorphic toxin type 15 domain-containing protein [Pseudoduganella albidiflava]|uniref:Novel toxin 15 domain-containing protein n=1 Tax=Pseudoduganella albidiflava TaxID=321983 RepID=A0A411X192_9BURK|nr:polymorphic toxin type 15 domain-containing protein [Pseudoduganella albidiflava]QBI02733.1 hypothetical protein EYF70_19170 [Pseudoduganella albidiflava]GGY55862.1 hypothetical protein GCM10007387_42830 [Pseudoduganella albidiflava]
MTGGINLNTRIAQATKALADIDSELAWEMAGTAADAAGVIDPTPTSDLIGAGIALRNGDFLGAGLSIASTLPYLGDAAAKPVKAARATKRLLGLKKKKAVIEKELADLNVLKKQEEAAEAAAKEAKIGKDAKKPADREKDAAQDEKAATKDSKDKDCEDCGKTGKPLKKMKKVKVDPCFSPKKLDPSKAKEFSEQLKRQEEALNRMTVKEYNDARAYFEKNKRSGTGKAQKDARKDYEGSLISDLTEEYIEADVPNARDAAIKKAKELMKDIAALHEPDMIAGGQDVVTSMGDRGVNSSIGSQWRNRVKSIDVETQKIPLDVQSTTKMNVKLPIC